MTISVSFIFTLFNLSPHFGKLILLQCYKIQIPTRIVLKDDDVIYGKSDNKWTTVFH